MNIAEICFSPSWGGLEHNCAYDAWLMKERGHNVIPFAKPDSPLAKHYINLNMKPVTLHTFNYVSLLTTFRMWYYFRKYRIDAVHFHRTQDLAPILAGANLAKVPRRILTLRMESQRKKKDVFHSWVYRNLTKVLTLTDRMVELVRTNVSIDPSKVRRLYNGVDVELLQSQAEPRQIIRHRWNIPQNAFVIGITGRIESGKGQGIVLKAAGHLSNFIPNIYMMIVGAETIGQKGEIDRLKMLAKEMNLEDRVVFTGYQRPAGKVVPAYDVAVLATRKETFGTVIIEAQALGIPVIGTNAGGVPEIIEHKKSGMLFEPENYLSLAEQIEMLYEDYRFREKLGQQGLASARKKFSIEQHVAGLECALKGE